MMGRAELVETSNDRPARNRNGRKKYHVRENDSGDGCSRGEVTSVGDFERNRGGYSSSTHYSRYGGLRLRFMAWMVIVRDSGLCPTSLLSRAFRSRLMPRVNHPPAPPRSTRFALLLPVSFLLCPPARRHFSRVIVVTAASHTGILPPRWHNKTEERQPLPTDPRYGRTMVSIDVIGPWHRFFSSPVPPSLAFYY